MTSALILVIAGLIGAALLGTTAQNLENTKASASQSERPASAAANRAIPVQAVQPVRRTLQRNMAIPATLEAYESADLYAKASGYVSQVRVDIGSAVRKGDPLATIDIPEMVDELHQAQSSLESRKAVVESLKADAVKAGLMIESAKARAKGAEADAEYMRLTFDRKKQLHEGRAIPDQELDEARSRLAVAEAKLKGPPPFTFQLGVGHHQGFSEQ